MEYIASQLRPLAIEIGQLIPDPENARRHNPRNLEAIKHSLKAFGQTKPIFAQRCASGLVVRAGNGTLEAALALGWSHLAVVFEDWDDTKAASYAIADNRTAELAEWDYGVLPVTLDALEDLGVEIEPLGFSDDERKDFEIQTVTEGLTDGDAIPEVTETICKPGDIWLLGDHRVMCGDSANIQHVEMLMSGQKADMVFTDPPYGVSYTKKNEYLNSIGTGHRLTNAIQNDEMKPEEMNEFWFTVLSNLHTITSNKASYYICSPQGGDLMMMMMSIIRAGWQLKHMLIWIKNNHVLGRCDYNYKHEPILYGWKAGGTHDFVGEGRCKTSVWDFNKPLKNDLHPTMKPIELCAEAVLNGARRDQIVIDAFLGSGSTLIACEKTNRKCFGMEIDPHYCDVIIKRWEDFTGKKAELLNSDQPL